MDIPRGLMGELEEIAPGVALAFYRERVAQCEAVRDRLVALAEWRLTEYQLESFEAAMEKRISRELADLRRLEAKLASAEIHESQR